MKIVEHRLHDENEKLSTEIVKLKKQIEEKLHEKYKAVEDAKAEGDQRVSYYK
jgi:hypothetical protein